MALLGSWAGLRNIALNAGPLSWVAEPGGHLGTLGSGEKRGTTGTGNCAPLALLAPADCASAQHGLSHLGATFCLGSSDGADQARSSSEQL